MSVHLESLDADHIIENVTFENCKLGNVYDETEYSYYDEDKEEDVEVKPAVLDEMPF